MRAWMNTSTMCVPGEFETAWARSKAGAHGELPQNTILLVAACCVAIRNRRAVRAHPHTTPAR